MQTYQVNLTMQELETVERALMTYQNNLSDYAKEAGELKRISSVCDKLSKA